MKNRVLFGLCAISLLLASCAKYQRAPLTPDDDPVFSEPIDMEPEGVDDDPPRPFRLRSGDVVDLHLFSAESSQITNLLVDGTGTLQVPLVGPVEVGGLTLPEAEALIENAMRKYDEVVRVAIIVNQPLGHQASVLGAVENPGRVLVTPGTRLADLLAAAGGPTPLRQQEGTDRMADLGGARLVRDGKVVPVSVERALTGDTRHNVFVDPGDHLYVPGSRGRAITVIGEVQNAGLIPYRSGIRLTQALALAGGLSADAHRRDIRVIRGPLGSPRVYGVNLKALVEGKGSDIVLAPGDIVFVTRTGVANVRDAIGAIGPILVSTGMFGANVGAILVTQ
ncbi:MAG: hypothetical protein GXY23_04105 [Myxococcales bacterium]|jgi:polysaccharide export outer membrane protein|nr:hypothetical protein [Myxococcales bacterium]